MYRLWAMLLLVTVSAALGCRADDNVKQGYDGEFCNDRDDDCRDGHICQDGVCRSTEVAGVTCGQMCQRLEDCQTGEPNCEADCRATIQGTCQTLACPWSPEAVESFGDCIISELTCDEARGNDAPQECYRRIPISDERAGRCDAFIAAADRCNPGVTTTDLRNRCFLLGRTSTLESWSRTDPCVDRVAAGACPDIESCYNSVFELSPAIDLGDGSIAGAGGPLNGASTDPEF